MQTKQNMFWMMRESLVERAFDFYTLNQKKILALTYVDSSQVFPTWNGGLIRKYIKLIPASAIYSVEINQSPGLDLRDKIFWWF